MIALRAAFAVLVFATAASAAADGSRVVLKLPTAEVWTTVDVDAETPAEAAVAAEAAVESAPAPTPAESAPARQMRRR
ncbi:MAG: hypothetical protein AAF684_01680, partial [Pseudomonadota bacterium]